MSSLQCIHKIQRKGYEKMIIKIFKISSKEMWTIRNKNALCDFIKQEVGTRPQPSQTIFEIIQYLPKENYHRVK